MNLRKSIEDESLFWLFGGILTSFISALFQVASIRIFPFVFPFSMLFLISLIAALSILFSGLGIAISKYFRGQYKLILFLCGIIPSLFLILLFLSKKFIPGGLFNYVTLTLIIISIPTILIGITTGIYFYQTSKRTPHLLKWLIAGSALAFFIGYYTTNLLLLNKGLIPVLFLMTVIPLFLSIRRKWVLLIGCSFLIAPLLNDDMLFFKYSDFVNLWANVTPTKQLGGKWSPYSRVDFVEFDGDKLAGIYNGKQQWMTSPNGYEDFDFRHIAYENIYGKVLLIGTGGAHGLLSLKNVSEITAVELDPVVVEYLKGNLSKYNGNIYNKVETYSGEGRAYLEQTDRKFNTIIYEGTDFTVGFSHRLFFSMEHYLYTNEGVMKTFNHLEKDGVLIALHTNEIASTRGLIKSLPEGTYYGVWQGIANGPIKFSFNYLVASKDISKIENWRTFMNSRLSKIKETTNEKYSLNEISKRKSITDRRPLLFFENYSQMIPLLILFGVTCLLVVFFIVFSKKIIETTIFSLIGTAYIMVELFIINVYRSWLGGFIETTAITLGVFTFFGALGNIFYKKIHPKIIIPAIVFSFAILLIMTSELNNISYYSKITWIAFSIAPAGFFMGTVFPKAFEMSDEKTVFKYLAADTFGSAMGFFLFYILTIISGLSSIMAFSAFIYFVCVLMLKMKLK